MNSNPPTNLPAALCAARRRTQCRRRCGFEMLRVLPARLRNLSFWWRLRAV
jgi:hypothetical protein